MFNETTAGLGSTKLIHHQYELFDFLKSEEGTNSHTTGNAELEILGRQ